MDLTENKIYLHIDTPIASQISFGVNYDKLSGSNNAGSFSVQYTKCYVVFSSNLLQ